MLSTDGSKNIWFCHTAYFGEFVKQNIKSFWSNFIWMKKVFSWRPKSFQLGPKSKKESMGLKFSSGSKICLTLRSSIPLKFIIKWNFGS